MLPGLEMMLSCPNLAVPTEVMRHVVHVESGANPFAIGVVGGHLVRQPKNLDEAVATANMLEAQGYNYSLGLAQVNRVNLSKYGLDTPAKAFDVCANLSAGANILAGCYRNANGDWGKAFSCYYSGNFVTGFLQGYVQKIYNSMVRNTQVAANPGPARSIPPIPSWNAAYAVAMSTAYSRFPLQATVINSSATRHQQLTTAQHIAMRRMPAHNPVNANANVASTITPATMPAPTAKGGGAMIATAKHNISPTADQLVAVRANTASGIFEPQVHGPHDPPPAAANASAGTRQETHDSAFVF
jgi:type IV secretion system protein VirB1